MPPPAEIQGLRRLRLYAVLSMVSILLSLSTNFLVPVSTLPISPTGNVPPNVLARELQTLVSALIPILALGFILQVTSLIFLRSGFKYLVQAGKDVKTGLTGSTLFLVSVPLLFVGVVVILVYLIRVLPLISQNSTPTLSYLTPIFGGVVLVVLGGLVALVGLIMVLIGLYKVGSQYGEGLIKVGAILTIIPYLDLVAPFLIFFGLGNAIKKAEGAFSTPGYQQFPPYPPQPPVQGPHVYQMGVGTIDDNGVARITLYSTFPLSLVSASLLTPLGPRSPKSILPIYLSPGPNNVEIRFDAPALPSGTYSVDITLSNGTFIRAYVTR